MNTDACTPKADLSKKQAHRHTSVGAALAAEGSYTGTLPHIVRPRPRDMDTMSVATSTGGTQVTSWKDDEHIQVPNPETLRPLGPYDPETL